MQSGQITLVQLAHNIPVLNSQCMDLLDPIAQPHGLQWAVDRTLQPTSSTSSSWSKPLQASTLLGGSSVTGRSGIPSQDCRAASHGPCRGSMAVTLIIGLPVRAS